MRRVAYARGAKKPTMLLHNDFPPGLAWAGTPRADLDAEQAAAFAAAFYASMWVGVRNAVVREVGFDAAYRLDEHELRGHQQAYFLDGVRKLGLEAEPSDAIRCAKYHALSNALGGGIRVRYAIESLSKAWIFYLPNFADPAVALHRDGVVTANYKGWHSNNGELLGNPRLAFVATHLLSRGDPYDAGYFLETTHEVPEEHRYSTNFGERPPSELVVPECDEREWPAERRARALRNYYVGWASDSASAAVDHLGDAGAAAVRHGVGATLYTWLAVLERVFAPDHARPPAERAAAVFAGVHEVAGSTWDARMESSGADVAVTLGKDLLSGGSRSLRDDADYAALLGAWRGPTRFLGAEVDCDGAGDRRTWRFTDA